ncbi:MAG: 50S ribosomal protein L3 N(5)-glutamine methyltransferase, partial [Pseudomonadota bacterium]
GHGTDNAADEARLLVYHALHLELDGPEYFLGCRLLEAERAAVTGLVDERIASRKPAAYLTGTAWFAGLAFSVNEEVLVPRSPLAELIAEGFAPWYDGTAAARILDLCTGSGCIGIACAAWLPEVKVDLADISGAALAVAADNVRAHGLDDRVALIESDLFDAVDGRYDIIVSNPPYVADAEFRGLPAEYHREPALGLVAGDDGLDAVHRILAAAREHLADDGVLVVEVGSAADALVASYPEVPFTWLDFERGGSGVFVLEAAALEALAARGDDGR